MRIQETNCTKCGATMTVLGTDKIVCEFCGNTVQIEQETPIVKNTYQQEPIIQREVVYVRETIDKSKVKLGFWMWVLFLFIPLVGFIMYFVYKSKDEKAKANNAITAAIIGFIINLIFLL